MSNENNQQELTAIREELRSLQERVDSISQSIGKPVAEQAGEGAAGKGAAEVAGPQPAPQPEPQAATPAPAAEQLAQLAEKIDTAVYQEGIIRDLHEELQKYKKGLVADIAKGYVLDIIRIHERLADTLAHFTPDAPDFDAAKTRHLVENNLLSIADLLEDQYSVELFAPEVGSEYKPKEYKAMRVIDTDDPAKAATVAECLAAGFRYAESGRILRQARVVVYRKVEH